MRICTQQLRADITVMGSLSLSFFPDSLTIFLFLSYFLHSFLFSPYFTPLAGRICRTMALGCRTALVILFHATQYRHVWPFNQNGSFSATFVNVISSVRLVGLTILSTCLSSCKNLSVFFYFSVFFVF